MATVELKAKIEADASQFVKEVAKTKALMASFPQKATFGFSSGDVDQVSAATRKFAASLATARAGMSDMSAMAGKLTAAGGVAAVATTLTVAGRAVLKFADDISEGASRMGISTESFQRWQQAAITSGSSMEKVEAMALKLQKTLGGDITDKQEAAFKRLGLDIGALQAMEPAAMFEQVAGAIAGLASPLERTRISAEIFGKGAKGVQDFAAALAEAKQNMTGLVSDEDIQKLAKLNDQMDAATLKLKRLGVVVASGILNGMTLDDGQLKGILAPGEFDRRLAAGGKAPTPEERAAFAAQVRERQAATSEPIKTDAQLKRESDAAAQATRDAQVMERLRAEAIREAKAEQSAKEGHAAERAREVALAEAQGMTPGAETPMASHTRGARKALELGAEVLRATGKGDLEKGIALIKENEAGFADAAKAAADSAEKDRDVADRIATIKTKQAKEAAEEAVKQKATQDLQRAEKEVATAQARSNASDLAFQRAREQADAVGANGPRGIFGVNPNEPPAVTRARRRQIEEDGKLRDKIERQAEGQRVNFTSKERKRIQALQDKQNDAWNRANLDKQKLALADQAAKMAQQNMAKDMASAAGTLIKINENIVKITARAA